MYTYRITKYNPKYRNEAGVYTKDEWTEFSDIGEIFSGKILTKSEYVKVEDTYVKALLSFLEESGIVAMKVNKVQNFKNIKYAGEIIKRNKVYKLANLEYIFRSILRGELWCKFKNKDSSYVDFGGEFYTYIGVPKQCNKSIALSNKLKLYVEKYPEPILD